MVQAVGGSQDEVVCISIEGVNRWVTLNRGRVTWEEGYNLIAILFDFFSVFPFVSFLFVSFVYSFVCVCNITCTRMCVCVCVLSCKRSL